jgi:hypothetical protein
MSSDAPRGSFRGPALNPKHTRRLANAIGGFLVNFGAIEMQADAWLHSLATDSLAAEELHRLPLSKRLHAIQRFIDEERLPSSLATEALVLWKSALPLVELRNQVAHNPVLFGWHGDERDGPPDFAGIIDKRKGVRRSGPTPGLIPLTEIEAAQDATAALAQKLFDLVERISAADAWPPEDPMPRKRPRKQ